MEPTMKFSLGQTAIIAASGERGEILGAARYLHCENNYLLRYKAADGRAVEYWWYESALTAEAKSLTV